VLRAATEVKRQLLDIASADLQLPVSELRLRGGKIVSATNSFEPVPISKMKGLVERQSIMGVGQPPPDPERKIIMSFGAQFAEVEVNTLTGEIRVLRLLAAHDSGRAVNPLIYESQVFGGMTMAIGFALTEKRVVDHGHTGTVLNTNWHEYKIPTAKDIPFEQACIPVDPNDTDCNRLGVKGLGELGIMPTAPAIANAIFHARASA